MATKKLEAIDLDAFDEVEKLGVIALRRRGRGHGAKLTKSGLTTAQTRVVMASAFQIMRIMGHVKEPLHSGTKLVTLRKVGKKKILTIQGR